MSSAGRMPSLNAAKIVLFDNNAYGDLTSGLSLHEVDKLTEQLVLAERRSGIQAMANPMVMQELVSLLEDRGRPAFSAAVNDIVALVRHCRISVDGGNRIAAIADPVSLLCRALFDEIPPEHPETSELLTSLLTYVYEERPQALAPEVQAVVNGFANHVRATEAQFVDQIYQYMVRGANPTTIDWAPLRDNPTVRAEAVSYLASKESHIAFGKMQVNQCLRALGRDENPTNIEDRAAWVAERFQIPIRLFNEILQRILTTGCNLKKRNRANWVWDLYIAFSIGDQHSVAGLPLMLVTSDGDLLAAASKARCAEAVSSYSAYRGALAR